jgi:hypothetical protein
VITKLKPAWLKLQPKQFSDADLASFIRWLEQHPGRLPNGPDHEALLLKSLKREDGNRKGKSR